MRWDAADVALVCVTAFLVILAAVYAPLIGITTWKIWSSLAGSCW